MYIFNPGDRAYWLRHTRWIYLIRNHDFPESNYPLEDQETHTYFTLEGKLAECNTPELLPLNPYNISDPNNPLEFKSDWPFILRGRRLEIGMEILVQTESGIVPARIMTLQLSRSGISVGARHADRTSSVVWSPVILFPDELPNKKKVAQWAYPIGINGKTTVGFTEEMTQEEARRAYGSSIRMIPGTEREVEG